jgi:hypothetical protein
MTPILDFYFLKVQNQIESRIQASFFALPLGATRVFTVGITGAPEDDDPGLGGLLSCFGFLVSLELRC